MYLTFFFFLQSSLLSKYCPTPSNEHLLIFTHETQVRVSRPWNVFFSNRKLTVLSRVPAFGVSGFCLLKDDSWEPNIPMACWLTGRNYSKRSMAENIPSVYPLHWGCDWNVTQRRELLDQRVCQLNDFDRPFESSFKLIEKLSKKYKEFPHLRNMTVYWRYHMISRMLISWVVVNTPYEKRHQWEYLINSTVHTHRRTFLFKEVIECYELNLYPINVDIHFELIYETF